MPTFLIDGDCADILSRLFKSDDRGHLLFGYAGADSLTAAKPGDLLAGSVRFLDYICEGFLTYLVQAEGRNPGCMLTVMGEGSNRDQYIRPAVRSYIKSEKLTVFTETDSP